MPLWAPVAYTDPQKQGKFFFKASNYSDIYFPSMISPVRTYRLGVRRFTIKLKADWFPTVFWKLNASLPVSFFALASLISYKFPHILTASHVHDRTTYFTTMHSEVC